MKKYTYIIICLLALQLSTVKHTHAGAGIVFDPTNYVENGITSVATTFTGVSTAAETLADTILQPLQQLLIATAQQQVADMTVGWINGGFSGGTPLIIANPEKYIQQKGVTQIKLALGNLPETSLFTDSIAGTLIEQYKTKDLKTKLAEAMHSDRPKKIQDDICSDASLTNLATEDVADADGNADPGDVAKRRSEIYNELCTGDPDTDPAVAKKLIRAREQVPTAEDLVALTEQNAYTVKEETIKVTDEYETTAAQKAHDEMYLGQKPVSQTKCLEEESPGVCKEGKEVTLNPGQIVTDALEKAANSGMDRLTNLQNGGLIGLITTLAMNRLTSGLNKAITSATKDIRLETGGGSSSSGGSGSGIANTGTVVSQTSSYQQDLQGDPETKQTLITPMTKQLRMYLDSLVKLTTIDNNFLNDLSSYESRLATGKACYTSLTDSGSIAANDSRITHAFDFYDKRQQKINQTRGPLNSELNKIDAAQSLANTALSTITNSNSSQELSKVFTDYTNTVDVRGYPDMMAEGTRKGEYSRAKNDMDNDFKDGAGTENAKSIENQCYQIQNGH